MLSASFRGLVAPCIRNLPAFRPYRPVVKNFIEEAAGLLRNAAAMRRAEANQTEGSASEVGAGAFRWLKARFEAARLEAQSKELQELGELIRKKRKK